MSTLVFTLREGILNLRRAPLLSLTSIAVMGLSLFVLGIFLLLTVNLRAAIVAVQRQVEIAVFLREDIRDAVKDEVQELTKKYETEVDAAAKAKETEVME